MNVHTCPDCGWEGKAPDEVALLFHRCTPPKGYHRRWAPPDLQDTTLEEVWLRVFADAYGGYDPPTPEQARGETGETGRRREGSGRRDP